MRQLRRCIRRVLTHYRQIAHGFILRPRLTHKLVVSGTVCLATFCGFEFCGELLYGNVLGIGKGLADSSLLNDVARRECTDFFERKETFVLGVCNGC